MKPVLVVLAAGMGSRYGGLKQLAPMSDHGQLILDYSLYDAKRAGFEEVIFVIRPEMEEAFQETIGARVGNQLRLSYAYQTIEDLPQGYAVPTGRSKPWGTAHAALAVRHQVKSPFAIINADDFYGAQGYDSIFRFLSQEQDSPYGYGLVGYALENTVTDHGTVSRGVCSLTAEGYLATVVEHTHIAKGVTCPRYSLDKGQTWTDIDGGRIVSMNLWGFQPSYLKEAAQQFCTFLDTMSDPLTNEFYLPTVADTLIHEGKSQVTILPCKDKWYGVTYPQDRDEVVDALAKMTQEGKYPANLWG